MKTVKFNEKEYKIPENWFEVTLKNVIVTNELSDLLPDAAIIAIISGYCNIPIDELKGSKANDLTEILETLEFIYKDYVPEPQNEFVFAGDLYSCPADMAEILFEDWVSSQTTLYRFKDNPVLGLSRLVATMCKRDGETLDSFDISTRAKELEGMSFADAKNIEGFFLSSLLAYRAVSQLSSSIPDLERQVYLKFQELESSMKQRSREPGTSLHMKLFLGIYRRYLSYIKGVWVKSSSFAPTKPLKKSWIQTLKLWLTKKLRRSN